MSAAIFSYKSKVLTGLGPLALKEIGDRLFHHLPTHIGDGASERDVFWTSLDAVLRVTTFVNAAVAHQRLQALVLLHVAGGVGIEQLHLSDGRRAHESGLLIELGTNFHTAATRDAAGDRIRLLLLALRLP